MHLQTEIPTVAVHCNINYTILMYFSRLGSIAGGLRVMGPFHAQASAFWIGMSRIRDHLGLYFLNCCQEFDARININTDIVTCAVSHKILRLCTRFAVRLLFTINHDLLSVITAGHVIHVAMSVHAL